MQEHDTEHEGIQRKSREMIQEANLHWRYSDTRSNLLFPWYTLPCLQWLEKQDVKEWKVFEYGAGYSTIWWRLNAASVKSVDHDSIWAQSMVTEFARDRQDYIWKISHGNHTGFFDCVVVDGEWRDECVEVAKAFTTFGGFIIVDNYDQEDFPPAEKIDALLVGWHKQVFKQPNHSSWKTAVFQKPA
jgi:hypothetical protein